MPIQNFAFCLFSELRVGQPFTRSWTSVLLFVGRIHARGATGPQARVQRTLSGGRDLCLAAIRLRDALPRRPGNTTGQTKPTVHDVCTRLWLLTHLTHNSGCTV